MSSFTALSAAIESAIEADTGSGGVFETGGSNKITYVSTGDAPDDQPYPYVTITPSEIETIHDFDGEFDRITVDVTLYCARSPGIAAAAAIAERLRTILSRVALTVTGYGTPIGLLEGAPVPEVDDETRILTLTLRYDLEAQ